MGKQRNFTCIFPDAQNVHLIKDVGMIANVLGRTHGYDSHFVCLDRGREFSYLHEEAKWLRLDLIKDSPNYRQFRMAPFSAIRYLMDHAKDIDVLMLLNHTRETMILAAIYKLMNPYGFFYLKLDANEFWLEKECKKKHSSLVRAIYDYFPPHIFVRKIPNLITSESNRSCENFLHIYPWGKEKTKVLPNGFDDVWFNENGLSDIVASDKEKLVISVGRIGTEQKNSEMLLNALESCDVGDWKIAFIGPIEDSFRRIIGNFYLKRPDLREKVLFVGEISDRLQLYSWYRRAMVFCITSRWEGFSLALVDALHFGCHIVATQVSSIDDVLDGGKIGKIVQSKEELKDYFEKVFSGCINPLDEFGCVRSFSNNFKWSYLCEKVACWIAAEAERY